MFIRYHIFFYALGSLLVICSLYHHFIFWLPTIIYLIYVYRRFEHRHFYILFMCMLVVGIPHNHKDISTHLHGKVVNAQEHYCDLKTSTGKVRLYSEEHFEYNDQLDVIVSFVEMKENTNDYGWNEKIYLYGQKIFYKAQLEKILNRTKHPSLYQWLESRFTDNNKTSSYQRMFILGQKNDEIQDDYSLLSTHGLVYLFALSGMHIHILYLFMQKIFMIFLKKSYSKIISVCLIGVYIFSIPMQISLYRAYFCLVLNELLKKWFHPLDILSFLVIISLVYNPYLIYNISFIFSYFIYFIVLITKKLPYSSLYIYLAGIPIVIFMQHQIPTLSFIFGFILTPFVEMLYVLTVISIFVPYICYILLSMIFVLQNILFLLERVQGLIVIAHPTLPFLVFYYILFFSMIYKKQMGQSAMKNGLILLSLMIAFSFYGRVKIYGEVTMLDVGQGDCTLIRLPYNQANVLIDTGGNRSYDIATSTIIPYLKAIGINKLDYVYISHDDYDHCGALYSLMQHFEVKNVIREYEELRKIGCMEIRMLKPSDAYTDANDNSLIMHVKLPAMSLLFMGDASIEVEKDLYKTYKYLDIDVLKVSHHGSKTSTSSQLLEMIHPRIAMIGVKKNNIYHHPSKNVIDRLNRKNINILRTDEDGMFHIRFYGKCRYILN